MSLTKCPPESEVQFGWRYWNLARGGWLLSPVICSSRSWIWPALRPMEAGCVCSTHQAIETASGWAGLLSPLDGCQCGIYATAAPVEQCLTAPVWGRVALWGKVLDCGINGEVRGWRAQYAYPYELFVRAAPITAESLLNHPSRPGMQVDALNKALGKARERVRLLRNNYRVDVSLDPSLGAVMAGDD